jgi:methyl-galactoside transport system substrate-binding protein
MIVDEWNANKFIMDKNKDNMLQYVMIKGNAESFATQERTMYVLRAIKEAGIKTQEIASVNANWNQDLAEEIIGSFFIIL